MRAARTLIPCLLAAAALAAPAAASAHPVRRPADLMVELINERRAQAGLRQLQVSASLTRSAGDYATWMMRADYFGHVGQIRAPNAFGRLGEVLERHRGLRHRARYAFRRWMRSPAHRAVLMSSGFRYIGVARVRGRYRGRRTTMWVGHLGARLAR